MKDRAVIKTHLALAARYKDKDWVGVPLGLARRALVGLPEGACVWQSGGLLEGGYGWNDRTAPPNIF